MLRARTLAEVVPVIERAESLARAGAWCVGHIAYEAAPAFDAALRTHALPPGRALVRFAVHDAPLGEAEAAAAWQAIEGLPAARVEWQPGLERADFDAAIARILESIAAGELYQLNFTTTLEGLLDGDPLALFAALRRAQPRAYAAWIDGDDESERDAASDSVLSVSPELFFDWRNGELLASPMKGTAARGAGPEEDERQRRALQASPKERAENVMIVDLLRNDLSRVAALHSVRVARLFHAEAWPTVWQLSSDVRCRTRPGIGLADILRALFPCGSVTGAPKVQAMREIHALETAPRGIYCGAVGLLQPGGGATFNVPIRTVALAPGGSRLRCGIGSGITADAGADGEWSEWRHKRGFVERASQPFELLETLRLDAGRAVDADAHLARMGASAAHFGFAWRQADARRALDDVAGRHPDGSWRVRLLAAPDGSLRAEAFAFGPTVGALRVALATRPLADSDGEFVRHKTTRRAHYDAFAPTSDAVFDTLLWNARGELTEFTRGNLALCIDGEWLTPAACCGLLPGIGRARLLAQGRIREAVLVREDLARARGIAFFNSLRGWLEVSLEAPDDGA
ncbi:chorismate-binding protein [Variovorax sp. J22P168]|uniref:chorismate-binding protein n=1 Tax=Variovorax jilinensis TaxID=3053513 RepID=UPI002576ADDB|nr:chorismate-binding protein [Variovorax sp. J22P168]MDM0013905.1 chorismate-binding protein [Variovorax sp. J22P168]